MNKSPVQYDIDAYEAYLEKVEKMLKIAAAK